MSGSQMVDYFRNKYNSQNTKSEAKSNDMMKDMKKSGNKADDDEERDHVMQQSGKTNRQENIYSSERTNSHQHQSEDEMSM